MSYLNRALSGVSSAAVLTLAFLTLTTFSAQADELSVRPGIEIFEEFSTNPTRARDRDLADSAFALRYKPNLEIETRGQTGFNRLKLGVNGRQYHDSKYENRDANDKFANFDFQRAISSRLSFFGSAGYYLNEDVDAILVERDGSVSPDGPVILTSDRPDIETLSGQFGFEYRLNPKSSLNVSAVIYDFDYDLASRTLNPLDPFRNQRDFSSNVGRISYNRRLTSRDSGFVQLSYRKTNFESAADFEHAFFDQETDPDTGTITFTEVTRDLPLNAEQDDTQTSVTIGWTRQWVPTLTTSLSGGTRRLKSERGSFHVFDPNAFLGGASEFLAVQAPQDGSSTSFTGSASLTKGFKRGQLQLFASRETRPSSGVSASVDETSYGFSYTHSFSGKLSARVGARNEFREAANERGFDDTARIHRYDASVRWRLRERWVAFVRGTSTDSSADNRFFSSYSDNRVSFGFNYAFGLDELSP